jgi:hypothetical protein
VLTLVPRGADAQLGPAAGEYVQCGHDLREQAGVAVGHTGDQQPEADGRGVRRQEAEGRVALQHRVGGREDLFHLEVVVHHRQVRDPRFLDGVGEPDQLRRDAGGPIGNGERDLVHSELHNATV